MDRLMALRAFSRVVELGGFTNAADSLQLSKTSVSDLAESGEAPWGAIASAHNAARDRDCGGCSLLRALHTHSRGS